VDVKRKIEQRAVKSYNDLSWSLLKDYSRLNHEPGVDLNTVIGWLTTVSMVYEWLYKEKTSERYSRLKVNQFHKKAGRKRLP
jgi:hypothetical protein